MQVTSLELAPGSVTSRGLLQYGQSLGIADLRTTN
jgi:hypothetical protein